MNIGIIRSLVKSIIAISMMGFIVWLICFILGICGWLWGLITVIVFFSSIIFFPHYKAGSTIPMSRRSSSIHKRSQSLDIDDTIDRKKASNSFVNTNAIVSGLVYSSIFAPAEVKRKSHMLVQVYLHLYEETDKVKTMAQESDKNAERRDYIPLQCKLKNGDKVDVLLNIYGEKLLMSDKKRVVWQGSFTKCSFDYFVPKDIDVDELSCVAKLFVNGAMIGEMRFLTQIVENPRNLNPEILSKSFKKIFISYAHKDFDKVKFMAKAYNAQGVDYFFDRDYLKAGDIYPKKIKDYIDTSDLFILCWSENAAKSEYVEKEKSQALSLSKNIDENKGTLTIHPLSIEPRAELPSDMKDDYNFEVI